MYIMENVFYRGYYNGRLATHANQAVNIILKIMKKYYSHQHSTAWIDN